MTNLVNLQRDQFHFNALSVANIPWPVSENVKFGVTLYGNADTNVDKGYGSVVSENTAAVTAGNWNAVGVYIRAAQDAPTPIRIKAHTVIEKSCIVIGTAPASPSGANDVITNVKAIPFTGVFDEIISNQPMNDGRALFVGVAVFDATTGLDVTTALSVQNLSTSIPSFAKAYS